MKKGLTLVELLVALAILTLVVGGIFCMTNMGYFTYSSESTLMDLMQQARNGMDRMVREIRASSAVTLPTSDKVIFTTPTASGVQYYRSGTQLIREYPSGTTHAIANNIALLNFTLNGSLLQIQVRADKTISSKTYSYSFMEKVHLRNE